MGVIGLFHRALLVCIPAGATCEDGVWERRESERMREGGREREEGREGGPGEGGGEGGRVGQLPRVPPSKVMSERRGTHHFLTSLSDITF